MQINLSGHYDLANEKLCHSEPCGPVFAQLADICAFERHRPRQLGSGSQEGVGESLCVGFENICPTAWLQCKIVLLAILEFLQYLCLYQTYRQATWQGNRGVHMSPDDRW